MSIIVHDPAYDHLPSEKSVTLYQGARQVSLHVHPWAKDVNSRHSSKVSVTMGYLDENGDGDYEDHDWEIGGFDRADFIEAILAVFPELTRA